MIIESVNNINIKIWAKLHQKKYRDETGLFLIEEEHLIEEALKANIVETIIINEGLNNVFAFDNIVFVKERVMNKLKNNVSSIKYMAVCRKISEKFIPGNRILILDRVQDPGNLGTLLRSALSFGFNQVICSYDCVDLYNDKVIRATQGAMFKLNIIRKDLYDFLPELSEYEVVGFALKNAIKFSDLIIKDKMAFIFGNEGQGIREEILKKCNKTVKIEMADFESLNVAIAGAIAMYSFRQI